MKRKTAFILAAVVSIGIANAQTNEGTHGNDSTNTAARTEREKYDPEIDRFLNTEDASIFTDFKRFNEAQIHPRSLNFYRLITEIHHLDSIVSITREMKASEFDKIRENINRAKTIRDSIVSYTDCEKKGAAYSLLSEPQKEFYRKLNNQYEKLDADYNPETNHGF
jgi:hypothetical protein